MFKLLVFSIVVSCNAHILLNSPHHRSERNVPSSILTTNSDNSMQPHFNQTRHRTKRNNCNGSVMLEYRNQIKCKPRPTVVLLEEDSIMVPAAVLVNRCNGYCRSGNCVATERKERVFYVTLISSSKCIEKIVLEDTKCDCECQQKATDCKWNQSHDKNKCKCVCMNLGNYAECLTQSPNKYWDEDDCECYCKEKACTTGSVWDKQQCKCV